MQKGIRLTQHCQTFRRASLGAVAARCLLAGAAFLTLGCGSAEQAPAKPTVTVLAAASTTDAIQQAGKLFEQQTGVRVRISTGPSNGLARQILAGAPADVFLSANAKWADAIRDAGLAEHTRPLLMNRLVLIVPADNPAKVSQPQDLNTANVRKVALAGENVPAGMYADQALRKLKLLDSLTKAGKIIRGHDVRGTMSYVERGEVEAGVVYATDAKISTRVKAVYTFADDTHSPIVYPIVLLKNRQTTDAGRQFYEFLQTDRAASAFRQYGFAAAG